MRQLKIEQAITNRDTRSLSKYFNELSGISMIPPEEEIELAQQIQQGDEQALQRLVSANLRFVVSVAKQYQNFGIALTDLIEEGNIGLIKAAKRFDHTRGFKFISYAVWWIRQQIQKTIQENGKIVRLPSNKQGLLIKINRAKDQFYQENSREPDVDELTTLLERPKKEIAEALGAQFGVSFLDEQLKDDSNTTKIEQFSTEDHSNVDDRLESSSVKEDIHRLLGGLTSIERHVVKHLFGLENTPTVSVRNLAARMGISKERVRQLKIKALQKIRSRNIDYLQDYLNY